MKIKLGEKTIVEGYALHCPFCNRLVEEEDLIEKSPQAVLVIGITLPCYQCRFCGEEWVETQNQLTKLQKIQLTKSGTIIYKNI